MTPTQAALAEFNRVYLLPPETPGRARMLCEALAAVERADAAHWRAGGDTETAEAHEREARIWDLRALSRVDHCHARGEAMAVVRP